MKYRWVQRDFVASDASTTLQESLNNLPGPLVQSLIIRGIDSFEKARDFFRPDSKALHDPMLMTDMSAAVDRILAARAQSEKVLVYGDYDVDGTTSVALLSSFLTSIGIENSYFIPNRIAHGYGLSIAGINEGIDDDTSLIIALDCGVTAVDEATFIRQQGLDLIVCDHHTPPVALPEAAAILNPKRQYCNYPFNELSACGVVFKLVQALATRLNLPQDQLFNYLDLVALSIGADIVPVKDENRILMALGIEQMRKSPRPGIKQLATVSGINVSDCSTGQIVFGFAPRINAAGRVDDASIAVDLMLTSDVATARVKANVLEELNDRRREIDQTTLQQANALAERMVLSKVRNGLVLYDDTWHPGVIGITASRIVERFYRPTVMLTEVDGVAKGSARSIAGLNIYDVLVECSDLLLQFGGHDFAAGMSLDISRIDEFRERFDSEVGKRMSAELMIPSIKIDALVNPIDITPRFWAVLKQFEPFGPGNSRPIYLGTNLKVVGRPKTIGKSNTHLKFSVRDQLDQARPFSVIGFDLGGHLPMLKESMSEGTGIDMLFSVEENEWNGSKSLQLRARDLRPTQETSATDMSTIVSVVSEL